MITINLTPRSQLKLVQFWLANHANQQLMSKIVFVPLTDEMVFERPDMITGPITTYQPIITEKGNRSVSTKDSLHGSGVYLRGDLVNGLDVVYASDKPTKRIKAKNTAV